MGPILLVEDDRITNMLLHDYLRAAGYEAETAFSGAEALAAIARLAPTHVVTDIDLGPGPDGFEVGCAARFMRRDVRVVFVSGRFSLCARLPTAAGSRFIAKPYRLEAILDALCDAPLPLAA